MSYFLAQYILFTKCSASEDLLAELLVANVSINLPGCVLKFIEKEPEIKV